MVRIAVVGSTDHMNRYLSWAGSVAGDQGRDIEITAGVVTGAAGERAPGLPPTFGSFDELLAERRDAFDAVLLHVPAGGRVDHVRRAASSGKHVFVESPLGNTLAAFDDALDECREANVRLMVDQPLRFQPYQEVVRQKLDSGKLGRPGLIRLHHWLPESQAAAGDASPPWAGCIVNEIDLACWLFAETPNVVYRPRIPEPARGWQLHLGFPSGGMALLDVLELPHMSAEPYYSLTLIGSSGAAYADDHHNMNLCFRGAAQALPVRQGEDHLRRQFLAFAGLASADESAGCTGQDARRAWSVALAAEQSSRAGRAVKWEAERHEYR